ncbi:MAG: CRTAC1 family protein [Phycisphaerales bacterium]|nr:CRTAC1 family protein [Phycisphaerales bacterium]MCB9855948.1 CRTAC1 family protein [Phycisphaerales bacterium]MCB9864071.1 CRTAC1 family protein [Phycisphaerales bacterium]
MQASLFRAIRHAAMIAIWMTLVVHASCRSESVPQDARGSETSAPPQSGIWFEEVAAEAGLAFTHSIGPRRYDFPETIAGGAALFDADGDGDLDVYFVQAGDLRAAPSSRPANQLFRNRGDGTFEDITKFAGVGDQGYGMGCAVGDYDSDGDNDLYVTNYGANVLYRNNGDGSFSDVTAQSGTGDAGWGTSAGFFDADNDGDLDLFVVNYINWRADSELTCSRTSGERDYCNPENYDAPARDVFYLNNGDGTFTDATRTAGIDAAFGNGLGLVFGDFNDDGRTDVYVANDGNPNQLWLNLGGNRFENDALLAGCAVNSQGAAEAGMGVAVFDVEPDGDLDLFMTHLRNESNTLYINNGGVFDDKTAQLGLAAPSIRFTAFGVGFADFDHDGRLDLYIANGKVTLDGVADPAGMKDPYVDPNQLMRGVSNGAFQEVSPIGGTAKPVVGTSRSAAFGDIDNDGDVDVLVVESDGPVRLLRNIANKQGNHFITFKVLDEKRRDALNARLTIRAGDRTFARSVESVYSFCAANDPRVHVGLGPLKRVDAVTVRWTDGTSQTFGPFDADKLHTLARSSRR